MFRHRRPAVYARAGPTATSSPEDLVLAKLRAFQQTGLDKHLRDARGVLQIQRGQLDMAALRQNARALGVAGALESLLAQVSAETVARGSG